MRDSLWVIVLIIVAFVSFLIGYSRPHSVKKAYTDTSSIAAPVQPTAMGKVHTNEQSGPSRSVQRQARANRNSESG